MKHLEDLLFWIEERESIRIKKELGLPRPWTNDPILHEWRFCNVYREDDVVTRWIHTNWLLPNRNSSGLPFAMVVTRMVNRPETLEDLASPAGGAQHTSYVPFRPARSRRKRCGPTRT